MSWMDDMPSVAVPGAPPAPSPSAPPTAPAWQPPSGFRAAPDGSGVFTDLSDDDYGKFMAGPPAQADDVKHFAFPPAPRLPPVNLPQIDVGADPTKAYGGASAGVMALPAPGSPDSPAIDVEGAKPTAESQAGWMDSMPSVVLPSDQKPPAVLQMTGVARLAALPASNLASGVISAVATPGEIAHGVIALGGQEAASSLQGNPFFVPPIDTGTAPLQAFTPRDLFMAPGKANIAPPTGHNPLDAQTLMGLTDAMGITNRPDLQPQNTEEKLAAGAMNGIGMMAPALLTGGASTFPAAARMAVTGVGLGIGSEFGGDIGQAVGGTPGRVVGSMAGAVAPALAGAGIGKLSAEAAPFLQRMVPFTANAQADVAARSLAAANTPENIAALAAAQELVPGSPVTSYQATGDPFLGAQERGMANQVEYKPAFDQVRQRQNAARVAATQNQAPGDADVGAITPWFQGKLDQMRINEAADVAEDRAATQSAVDAMGNPVAPHDAGAVVRHAAEASRTPALARSDQAIAEAQTGAEGAAKAIGGEASPNGAQAHGERMRGEWPAGEAPGSGLLGRRASDRAYADRLYQAVDPDKKLVVGGLNSVGDTASILRGDSAPRKGWSVPEDRADQLSEYSAAGRADLAPAEAKALDFAAELKDADTFQNLRKLQRMISAGQRSIAGNLSLGRESLPYRRMTELRNAVEDAMSRAAGDAARSDATVAGRLSAIAKEDASGPVSGAGSGQGDGGGSGGGTAGVSGQGGSEGQGAGRSGVAGGDRAVAPEASTRKPESLIDFLISKGGVKDQGGELRANDLQLIHHKMGGRLINPNGLSLDYAREAAAEAGFIRPNADINEFLDAVTSQGPVYRISETADAANLVNARKEARRDVHDRFMANADIDDAVSSLGVRLSPEEHAHAAELRMAGHDPEDAVKEAARASDEDVLQRNAERNAFGSPGVPLGASQAEMPVERNQLIPNFTPEAQDALRKANANYADYKAKYGTGVVGKVLAPSGRTVSGYNVEPSAVPSTLFAKGASGAEAADSLIRATGSPEAALNVLGEYPAYSLRQAAEEMGTLSVPKYNKWLADHQAVMDKFPELKASFDTAAKARAVLDDLKTQRAAIEAANPIKPGWGDAELMGKFVVPGPKGYESAGKLLEATNGSPTAVAATRDYLASSLRDAAEVKSGPNAGTLDLGAYQRWMKQYQPFLSHPSMGEARAAFEDAAKAQGWLDASALAHRQAQKAYEDSVARHFLGRDTDPVSAIGTILGSRTAGPQMADLARITASDPVAREAIQAAAIKYMLRLLKSNNPVGSDLTETYLKSNEMQNFIRQHVGAEGEGALRHVMTPEQLDALNNVALDLRRSNLSISGNKNPGGSDTGLITSARHASEHSPALGSTLAMLESLGELGRHVFGPVGRVAGMIAVPILTNMRKAGFQSINDLRAEALLHPEKMTALLSRLPSESEAPSRLNAIKGELARAAVTAGTRAANQNEPDQQRKIAQ